MNELVLYLSAKTTHGQNCNCHSCEPKGCYMSPEARKAVAALSSIKATAERERIWQERKPR